MFLAICALAYKQDRAQGAEHRRGKLVVLALVVGMGLPFLLITMDVLFPRYLAMLRSYPVFQARFILAGNLLLLTVPFLTTYAVLAHKVLDVRLMARSAVQHLLARSSASALGLTPFVFLIVFLWSQRHETLVELASGAQGLTLLVATALGVLFMRFREPILDAVDRRFFRDRYDARRVLTELADQVRGTRNLGELSRLVGQGVDLALHLDRVALLTQDPKVGRFIDPLEQVRPLDLASKLATLVQGHQEPLEINFDARGPEVLGLEEDERHWLVDSRVSMIAPAYALDGELIGILVLGGKKSELPFLKEDREMLQAVCSAAGLVMEVLALKDQAPAGDGASRVVGVAEERRAAAGECLVCSRILPRAEGNCPQCDFELEPASVPYVLNGQFRFEKRLGTGGMAVVYRGTDLRLGRPLAIKTLPRVAPEAAVRLHHEARAAANVTHQGLAAIYGIETWRGVPMILLELLPGGTLGDQLAEGRLEPLVAIETGQTVALALHKIHAAGILHRDVKPSNIGYTEEGYAKLLDFGIARIQHDLRQRPDSGMHLAYDPGLANAQLADASGPSRTRTGQIMGTVPYLSPEAASGARPEPSFDLWSLAVVLWEALTAKNLFLGRDWGAVLAEIRGGEVRSLRDHLPGCPEPLAAFFDDELALDRRRRSSSGREMWERLERLRLELLGSSS
ncbi:MAG: serine/threonine-protein kinase, partial [Acidobacteriota bacterium]